MSISEVSDLFYTILKQSRDLQRDIVAIFFFCYDLTDRALSSQSQALKSMTSMLTKVMTHTVWPVVKMHGGWVSWIVWCSILY